jgi:hypothetical protein
MYNADPKWDCTFVIFIDVIQKFGPIFRIQSDEFWLSKCFCFYFLVFFFFNCIQIMFHSSILFELYTCTTAVLKICSYPILMIEIAIKQRCRNAYIKLSFNLKPAVCNISNQSLLLSSKIWKKCSCIFLYFINNYSSEGYQKPSLANSNHKRSI